MSQSGSYFNSRGLNFIATLTGNTGGPVGPDGSNNINVVGAGNITVAGNPATHTETISIVGVIPIVHGGTNASSFATVDGTIYYNGSSLVTTSTGTAGQVLTSNGAGSAPTYQNAASSGIQTITGNTGGPISPTAGNINIVTAHSTVVFAGAGSTETLDFGGANLLLGTDGSLGAGDFNVGVGSGTLGSVVSGDGNVGVGFQVLPAATGDYNVGVGFEAGDSLTSGDDNVFVGGAAGAQLLTGSANIGLGKLAAYAYTGAESNNIAIGSQGVVADSGVIRIGTSGTHTSAYMAGVAGFTVSNANTVTIDTVTGQLGSTAGGSGITTIDGDTGSATGSTITFNGLTNAGNTVKFVASGSTVDLLTTDPALNNTFIGLNAGVPSPVDGDNTAVGSGAMASLTTGTQNVALGGSSLASLTSGGANTAVHQAFQSLSTGSNNIGIGYGAGISVTTGGQNFIVGVYPSACAANYTSSESDNICIFNQGVTGESNTIRIGASGSGNYQQNQCFIGGIDGVGLGVATVVTEISDQLGTATILGGTNITVSTGATTITLDAFVQYFQYTLINNTSSPYNVTGTDYYISVETSTGAVTVRLPDTPTQGRVVVVKDRDGSAPTNNITVTTVSGTDTIDGITTGATTFVMNTAYQSASFIFDGSTGWEIF